MNGLRQAAQETFNRKNTAAGLAMGLGFVALTTIYNHREKTHDSLKTGRIIRAAGRVGMWLVGVKPRIWADVHTTHHSTSDANFIPMLETADYLEYRDENPDITEPPIPEVFSSLDPAAKLSPDEIKQIGGKARELVAGRYERPESYSLEEAARLLEPDEPRYFYANRHGFANSFRKFLNNRRGIDSQPDPTIPKHLAGVGPELRDPHSPSLHKQGILGVGRFNVGLYRDKVRHSEMLEKDGKDLGKDKWDERVFDNTQAGPIVFFIGNVLVQAAMKRDLSPKGMLKHTVAGSFVATTAIYTLLEGGKITNAFGHGGKTPIRTFIKSLFVNSPPKVKPDGTYTSNAKILNLPTLDEVGGQEPHHNEPGLIAYSIYDGLKRFIQAPFGTSLSFLAKRKVLMEEGDQFKDHEGRRPDLPSEAVLMLEVARRRSQQQLEEHNLHSEAA